MPEHDKESMVARRGCAGRACGRTLHPVFLSNRLPVASMVHGRSFRLSSGPAGGGRNCSDRAGAYTLALDRVGRRILGRWCASLFEASLKENITLAFFLPLMVYMADAVGTQTETILVRALAYGRVSLGAQLLREGAVGLLIGGIVGLSAGACLLAWGGARSVAFTLAITLALTAMIATFVASLLPIGLSRAGVDPALASGPVATVVQDILSVAVYLGLATLIL